MDGCSTALIGWLLQKSINALVKAPIFSIGTVQPPAEACPPATVTYSWQLLKASTIEKPSGDLALPL